jgi:hypothetical protein
MLLGPLPVSTYLLLRRLARAPASAAGGTAFALNGTFAWLYVPVNPVAFLPLLLLGVEVRRGGEGRRAGSR